MQRRRSRTGEAAWLLAIPLLVAGCVQDGAAPRTYAGPAPGCGRTEGGGDRATLTVLAAGFAFAPYDGSLVVSGRIATDGSLAGRLDLHPAHAGSAGGPAQVASATGRITADSAAIAYAAPGCVATVTLGRVRRGLL